MPASWIVEAIDVFKDGDLSVATCSPGPLPEHLSLDHLEEGFDRRIEAPISVKQLFGEISARRVGDRFHGRCSALGNE